MVYRETPTKLDDLGVPPFMEIPLCDISKISSEYHWISCFLNCFLDDGRCHGIDITNFMGIVSLETLDSIH